MFIILGGCNKTGQTGTGFIVLKKARKYMLRFETCNEGICKLKIKSKYNTISLINVHASTLDKTDEIKKIFIKIYNLESIKVQTDDIVNTIGDLNTKFGKEGVYRNVTGKHTYNKETNENGEMLREFAFAHNMTIRSTIPILTNKAAWISQNQTIQIQTNHILGNANKKEVIQDIRSKRGPNINSDTFLQKVIVQQNIKNIHKNALKSNNIHGIKRIYKTK